MGVTVIDSLEEFNEIIKKPSPVVVEFYAKWCGPSLKINPKFDRCSERLQYDGLGFYRVDIDNDPVITQVADVQKIPFFVVYKEGKRLGSVEGADNRALATLLETHS
jgi:thioredoxin 1